jgi:ribosomal protein L29
MEDHDKFFIGEDYLNSQKLAYKSKQASSHTKNLNSRKRFSKQEEINSVAIQIDNLKNELIDMRMLILSEAKFNNHSKLQVKRLISNEFEPMAKLIDIMHSNKANSMHKSANAPIKYTRLVQHLNDELRAHNNNNYPNVASYMMI